LKMGCCAWLSYDLEVRSKDHLAIHWPTRFSFVFSLRIHFCFPDGDQSVRSRKILRLSPCYCQLTKAFLYLHDDFPFHLLDEDSDYFRQLQSVVFDIRLTYPIGHLSFYMVLLDDEVCSTDLTSRLSFFQLVHQELFLSFLYSQYTHELLLLS
jgi:hypothetical protein